MASSEAMKRASKKYDSERIDRIAMRVPKGMREELQIHAETHGDKSLNAFLWRAVTETIERDNQNTSK